MNEELVGQTFVHIVESGEQDCNTVVTIMEHVLQTLKSENPTLNKVVYRQDNAGCYHCAITILACKLLREKTSLDLYQIDFCDPQGGKGPCDRKAAQIKTHIKQFINQGNSVTTSADLKKAIESNGGVSGVRVTLVPIPKISGSKNIKWDGISSLSNFVITTEGVRSFEAYGIGLGNFQLWTSFPEIPCESQFEWMDAMQETGEFVAIKQRNTKASVPKCSSNEEVAAAIVDVDVGSATADSHLFSCPEDGCIMSYMTHGRLEQHLVYGKHKFGRDNNVSLLDKAKSSYAERLEAGVGGLMTTDSDSVIGTGSTTLPEGWASRGSKKTRYQRFTEKQKTYLEKKFNDGEKTGVKANPDSVSKEMRHLRDHSGKRVFTIEEFLRPQQISSFFSRSASKRKGATESDDEVEEFTRNQITMQSNVLEALKHDVSRPVLFSGKTLCQMKEEEITNLKITQLRSMTSHFAINVKGRTKAVYSDAMIIYLNRCSCKVNSVEY